MKSASVRLFAIAFAAAFAAEGADMITAREATNIAERVVETSVTTATTPIPERLTNLVSYVVAKADPETGEVRDEDEDGSVVIGKDASGTIDPEYVDGLGAKTHLRSEAVAIGHGATVSNLSTKATVQGIAVGWNAKAVGSNAIAIGGGASHWYEGDLDGGRTYANGGEAVAFGYGARATASRAVQIGNGLNTEAETLKFRDTVIVKDGKVQGGGADTNAVKGIVKDELDPALATAEGLEVEVKSHAITTVAPSADVSAGDEMYLNPTGTRNFEVYLPNVKELRAGLPIQLDTEIEGEVTRLGPWWTNRVVRLPAKVTMKEPLPKTLILGVEEYDDGWDWTPAVARAYETNGEVRVEGTNLHFTAAARIGGVTHRVTNPLYGAVSVPTNGVGGATGELIGKDGAVIAAFAVE